MIHGHEKSDLVIVAMKRANKAKKAPAEAFAGRSQRCRWSEGRGPRGIPPAKHAPGIEPGKRVKGVGAYAATCAVTHPRQEPYAGKPHVRSWAGGVP
jgi:hypothetical protein